MSEDGYEVFEDPYCYKGTFVLKNRAGLRDAVRLQAFELEMSSLRAEEPLPAGRFGPAHYRALHRHLFGDVYSWAGGIALSAPQRADTSFAIRKTSTGK